ncbi:TonB-dependent receptor [Sphingomonas sp. 37zxx]|uniref:TonB-dependent receptor n=1 Tax=Sphingomonas sp. 37zxx TaxID=1550073 RepID=UPI00068A8036|nr:TonB-dependent receptor [Sphingomonas sp. 37zxx]
MPHYTAALTRTVATCLLCSVALPAIVQAQTVTGTVTDSTETRGLRATEIELVELGRTTNTDREGGYRFTDVPAGDYTLVARYTGAPSVERSIAVPASGDVVADFRLGLAGEGEILVVGQRATLSSSVARQRAAEGVQTVLTRDAIGQFPDQNVAEALRRAPGINVLNDQGEGRFVSVRGLDPNLNATSINGNRVLATGGDERAAALDVIPSELVESIEVKKSLTPDMDADTLGGSIEIKTTSAFDRKTPYFGVSLEGSYNDLVDVVSPKAGVDFSIPIGSDFGVAGGVSYYNRIFGSDNVEANGWGVTDDGVVFADEIDYRDYDVTRERIGANLSFDARIGSTTEVYVRGLYSRFSDEEFRRRLIFALDAEPSSGTDTSATFLSDDGEIEVIRDLKDRTEIQTIKTVSLGGRTETGPWRLTYDAAYSQATQVEDNSSDPITFSRKFEDAGDLGVTFDYSDLRLPKYTITAGDAAFRDPASYEFDQLEVTARERAKDEEYSLRFDATRTFALGMGTFDVQSGIKARFRDKRLNFAIDLYDGYDGDLSLADFVGPQSYGLARIDPVPGADEFRKFLSSNRGFTGFERNAVASDFASTAEDFSASEDVLAGYLLGRLTGTRLRVVGGVRVERTRNEFFGQTLTLTETDDDETLLVTPVSFKRDYTDWLPSLNIRYEPATDLVLRAAAFRSLVRPGVGQVAPRFIIEENQDGERSGEFGNPDLQPYRAWNFDATVEYYFARDAVIQLGAFYKSIDNFIVTAELDDVTFQGLMVDEAAIPFNGESAKVKGLEFSYQQALTFLPSPLDGLLVNFNYTLTDAKGRIAEGELLAGREIDLPAASKHTFNAVLGYEKGPISLRFAGAYRSSYLDEVGDAPEEDRIVDNFFQFDVTAKYRITPRVQMFAELVNAFDEPYLAYQRGPAARRLLQYEEYSWTGKLGVRANF